MQDINGKETELGDAVVDGTVGEMFFFLQPSDKITQIVPGDIFWLLIQNTGQIIQVSPDVGRIRCHGMVSKATEGDHLPKLF